MSLIRIGRSYEAGQGPETATAEDVRIGTKNVALCIRWKSAQDGRTPCLYVSLYWFRRGYDLISRKPKDE